MSEEKAPQSSAGLGRHVWLAGVLGNAHDAAVAITNFRHGSSQAEFFNSRTLSLAGLSALVTLQRSLVALPDDIRRDLVGVDWAGLKVLADMLPPLNEQQRDEVWAAMGDLVPGVLMGLNRLRRHRPAVFNPLGYSR
jgi:uncharacterized protein with HEPN domain